MMHVSRGELAGWHETNKKNGYQWLNQSQQKINQITPVVGAVQLSVSHVIANKG